MSNINRGAGSSGNGASTASANNYYGFGSNLNDNDITGGGLSFVIQSAPPPQSISSVGSTSSGISSGSSTITKSSAFNGNTFTRSKPKDRKPLPNGWAQEAEREAADGEEKPLKGSIPSVTVSEATPSPKKLSNKGLYYFDTSNSNSSSGSVIIQAGHDESRELEAPDHSVFSPGACSTFILTEGEEFPGEESSQFTNSSCSSASKNGKMKVDVSSFKESPASSKDSSGTISNGGTPGVFGTSGEEESFECFGDGSESFIFQERESTTSGSGEASLQYSRDGADLDLLTSSSGIGAGSGGTTPLSRNGWTRTSLRKSPQNNSASEAMGYRRYGSFRNPSGTKRTPPVVNSSNALANQLYRSSSFHSSGRSSAGDAEEMYSDGSLEDDVMDLSHKIHHLEEKVNVLVENQTDTDDRYTREKEKNAELSTKVFMLEEQLRETELRGDEKLKEEQRRLKEFQSRWEREKQLQSENYEIRLQSLEKDLNSAKTESQRVKEQLERNRGEKETMEEKMFEMERELSSIRDENRLLQEEGRRDREEMSRKSREHYETKLVLEKELENMKQFQMQNSPSSLRSQIRVGIDDTGIMSWQEELEQGQELKGRVKEYEEEIKQLKKQNKELQETKEDLQAQLINRSINEGLNLLNPVTAANSLAAEFEAMSTEQTPSELCADSETDLAKVKKALKEQIEVTDQLRSYIDGILLIIVENNPQLLEVRNNNSPSTPSAQTGIVNPNHTMTPQTPAKSTSYLPKISFSKK